MNTAPVECLQQANAILGEGPIWHPDEGALYWIDILRPAIYRFTPGKGQTGNWPMPSAIGAIGLCGGGHLIVALESQAICLLELSSGKLQRHCDPTSACGLQNVPGRFNDGRVDALGNFWVGWLTHDRKRPGALFRIEPSGAVRKVLDSPVAPNGLGWSPDGRIMYVTDSHINTIWAYECDLGRGKLGNRRKLAKYDRSKGVFDGLCVDSHGNIWSALYGGGAVVQLDPDGRELTRIALPTRLVTACSFGGDGLRTLFVTSAIRKQNMAELLPQPLAGALFALPVSVAGQLENLVNL